MNDEDKIKKQLIEELGLLRQRIVELEASEAKYREDEKALKESERRYRLLAENVRDVIWTMDLNLRFTYVSPSVTPLTGFTVEEMMAKNIDEIMTPESVEKSFMIFERELGMAVNRGGDSQRSLIIDIVQIHKDGSLIPVEIKLAFLRDYKDHPVGIIGVSRDITERKRAEERLLKEKKFTESVINCLPGIFYLFDENGKFIIWNENFEVAGEYSSEEISKMSPLDFCSDEDKNIIPRAIHEVFTSGKFEAEAGFLSKSGKKAPYLFTGSRLMIENQPYLVGMGIDITERKKAYEALSESEKRFRELADLLPQVVCEIDEYGTITFANSNALKVFGYTQEDLEDGLNGLQMIVSEDQNMAFDNIRSIVKDADKSGHEYTGLRKDGSTFPVLSYSSPIFQDNKYVGMRSILIDITERKQAEEKLKQSLEEVRSLSLTDDLTNLYNRRGFLTLSQQQLKLAERMNEGILLIYADLDSMKWINDTFGHQEGDRALIEVANVLKKTFRESDILSRFGGDEYAILTFETVQADGETLIDRLQRNMKAYNENAVNQYNLSISIGMARYNTKSPCSVNELLDRADKKMYEQKRKNRRLS